MAVFVRATYSVERNKTVVDLGESAGSEIFKEPHAILATQFALKPAWGEILCNSLKMEQFVKGDPEEE